MSQYFMKSKDILKIVLTIVTLWLVSVTLNETFSSYVEPVDYNDEVEYGIQYEENLNEVEALSEVDNEPDVDEIGDDTDDTANVDEVDSEASDEAEETDDGDEENPLLEYRDGVYYEYRDGVYYWTEDMDGDEYDPNGITPFNWTGNATTNFIVTGTVNTNGWNRTGGATITVGSGATLIMNTGAGGTTAITGRIIVNAGGTLIIHAGTVTAPTSGSVTNGGFTGLGAGWTNVTAAAVTVNGTGTATMHNGTLTYAPTGTAPSFGNASAVMGYGHSGTVNLGNGGTFTMYGGTITGNNSRGVRIHGGTLNVRGGNITGNNNTTASMLGGGVHISGSNSTINMSAGSISNNTTTNGGGILYHGGQVRTANGSGHANGRVTNVNINLSGGTISHNRAVSTSFGGGGGIDLISDRNINSGSDINLNLSGDIEISHNTSVQSGGGIRWNSMGIFTMTGGHIHNNQSSFAPTAPTVGSARFAGGGIAILFSTGQNNARQVGDVTITGGIIENNSSHGHGGGINNTTMAHLTIGGDTIIRGNTAGWGGGGVRSSYAASTRVDNLTIRDDVLITNNRAHHGGGGVARVGAGTLTISDNVRVINNIAHYDGGGIQWGSSNTFNLNNATISGNLAESRVVRYGTLPDEHFGGGGGMTIANGTVNIRGGIIGETIAPPSGVTDYPPIEGATPLNTMTPNSNRGLSGGGVRVTGGTVTMTGGYIQRNVTTTTPGSNTALEAGRGGGVFVNGGRFIYNVPGENIRNNLASRGGGAYVRGPLVAGAAPFVITTGSIRDNEAMLNGGGGYVALTSRIDMNGGLIQGNIAHGTGSVGPNPVFGQPLQGITPGAANYNGHGGGVYVAQNALFRATSGRIIENSAITGDGGGIYTENRQYSCTISPAGATGFYSNITIGAAVVLGGNSAYRHTLRTPCNPTALTTINASVPISTSPFPGGAWPSFPNGNHPLNNFDVNYLVTYDVPPPLDPEITKVAINPSTGAPLTAEERVLLPRSTVTYRITVTNPNQFVLEDQLVIDNLANGRLTNVQINPIGIVPSSALVTRSGESPVVVENEATGFDELHVILDLPAATATADGVVTITFTASLAPNASGAITNWVYLFGSEDNDGDRGQVIVPDENHEDGYYREGYIDNDDETVTGIPPDVPDIIKEVIDPETGEVLPIADRVFAPEATITYRITVINTNRFIYEDHLVIDNLANGRLINAQLEPSGIVPTSALVSRAGESPAVVENEITGFDELHVILDLPAATASADGIVTITFTADVAPNVTGSLVNWVYIFGPEDDQGNRQQLIIRDDDHEDGYYREGYISNDDEEVTIRVPAVVPEISKSADYNEPVFVGDDIKYTITVENPNDFALVGDFEVVDGLIEYVELVDQTSLVVRQIVGEETVTLLLDVDYKVVFDVATGVLSVTFNGLPANSITEITFIVEVVELPEGGYVPNIAVLHLPDNENLNNFPPGTESDIPSNEVEVPVVEPVLLPEIEKSADYTEPVHVGDDVEYSIVVENLNDVALVGDFEVIDGLVSYVDLVDQSSVVVTRTVNGVSVAMVRGTDYTVGFDDEAGVLRVTFSGLPASSVTEIVFTVEVVELPAGGYVPNIAVLHLPDDESLNHFPPGTGAEIPSNEVEVPVVSPSDPEGVEFRFVKANEYLYIDMDGNDFERLDGARFELRRYVDGEWEYIETVVSQGGANLGLVVFESLLSLDGVYRLDETRPPNGFRLPQGYWIVTWNAGTGSFDIEARGTLSLVPAFREVERDDGVDLYLGNFRETLLPASGGLGAMVLTSIGILSLSFVVLLYVRGRIVEAKRLKGEVTS